jgi:hypothetical protein
MNFKTSIATGLLASSLFLPNINADERRFTYVYEPETLPQGAAEIENWVTLRAGRNQTVGKENYNRWDLRQEFEYGVTDRYTLSFYLNEKAESYRDAAGEDINEFEWKGISLENIYNVLNPADNPVGLSLYLEGAYSGEEAALEQKIIFGQRHGDWKWALNLIHETEWEDNLHEIVGEAGLTMGLARDLGKNWALGLEFRNVNSFPEYDSWENSALFLGPVVSYRQEKWWAALTVLPQIYGWNNSASDDGNPNLDLRDHEKLNIRFLIGIHL